MMTSTRKLALIASLAAISFLLMFFDFPLLPGADFLKVDFSILPILLGLVMLDFKSSMMILFLRSLLKIMLHHQGVTTWIGLPMNMVAIAIFVAAFALLWKKEQTKVRFILASFCGTIGLTLAMFILNYFYAIPLYALFAHFDIAATLGLSQYLFAIVIPFNLIEGVVFAGTFWLLHLALRPVLRIYEK